MHKKILFFATVLSFFVGLEACQKDALETNVSHNEPTDYEWGQGDSVPIFSSFYMVGRVDSQLYTMQDSLQGYYNYAYDSSYVQCPDDTATVFYSQITGMYTLSGLNSMEVKFLMCADTSGTSGIDSTNVDSLIFAGTYPYGSSDIFNPIHGVEITWVDDLGKVWKTRTGSGAETNNSFYILGILPSPSADSFGHFMIVGKMSVTLWNGMDNIRVEDMEFQLQYGVV